MAAGGEPVETRETEVEDSLENNSVLTVLSKGDTIHYIVPSFPVYSAELVEIKVQWSGDKSTMGGRRRKFTRVRRLRQKV